MSFEDHDHPVLPDAWRYEIIGLRLELAPEDGNEPFLDLTLRKDGSRRQLRFFAPQSLEIEADVGSMAFACVSMTSRGRLARCGSGLAM